MSRDTILYGSFAPLHVPRHVLLQSCFMSRCLSCFMSCCMSPFYVAVAPISIDPSHPPDFLTLLALLSLVTLLTLLSLVTRLTLPTILAISAWPSLPDPVGPNPCSQLSQMYKREDANRNGGGE